LPSWEGTGLISRRCAGSSPASATDRGRVRPRHSLVAQRQSARLLTGKSGFESLLGSEPHEAVAQLVRAPGRQLGGRRFKSGQSRPRSHSKRGRPSAAVGPARSLSSAGRASARRAEGRWFEAISDHASAHRLTDRALAYEASGGGSSPPGRTRRSVAQWREQPVHTRQAQVRVLPDRLRTNRKARSLVVSQAGAGSSPVVLPGGSERRTAQLPVKQSLRHPWFDPRFRHLVLVAQLDSAAPSEGAGRPFESGRGRQWSRDRAVR
jgi:hypothetical protein